MGVCDRPGQGGLLEVRGDTSGPLCSESESGTIILLSTEGSSSEVVDPFVASKASTTSRRAGVETLDSHLSICLVSSTCELIFLPVTYGGGCFVARVFIAQYYATVSRKVDCPQSKVGTRQIIFYTTSNLTCLTAWHDCSTIIKVQR